VEAVRPEERGRQPEDKEVLRGGLPLPAGGRKSSESALPRKKKGVPRIHSLILKKLKLPARLLGNLRKLGPDFVIARYPDAAQGLPSELYDRKTAEERLRLSTEVLRWVEKALKK
jgi:HEPN domain-containing protein